MPTDDAAVVQHLNDAGAVLVARLETARTLGTAPTEVALPGWPYDSLNLLLFAEAAAAFEDLTLGGSPRRAACRTA